MHEELNVEELLDDEQDEGDEEGIDERGSVLAKRDAAVIADVFFDAFLTELFK